VLGKEHDQTDDSIGPSGRRTVVVTGNLVDENTVLLGTGDFSSGTINGEITVTPEPRSFLLLMIAIFACASYRVWPRRARNPRPRVRLASLSRPA